MFFCYLIKVSIFHQILPNYNEEVNVHEYINQTNADEPTFTMERNILEYDNRFSDAASIYFN